MKFRLRWYIWLALLLLIGLYVGCVGFFEADRQNDNQKSIPIAMALDDNYTYPTIVAITSVMENSDPDTKYEFHIMHPSEFEVENKDKLRSLESKYGDRCRINLIDMESRYNKANLSGYITTPTYYRLSLSEILPDVDKIIWLDGDTLTFTDLSKMYHINMRNRYYDGFLDYPEQDEFAVLNDHYICAGVMLINLNMLRTDNIVSKFDKFIEKNNENLSKHDQTTINAVCGSKNGVLPAKYGIFNFKDAESAGAYSNDLIARNKYSKEELMEAYKNPSVLHLTAKPWNSMEVYGADKWWSYAEKTDFYNEIKEKYNQLN